jgi:hypothetical protein
MMLIAATAAAQYCLAAPVRPQEHHVAVRDIKRPYREYRTKAGVLRIFDKPKGSVPKQVRAQQPSPGVIPLRNWKFSQGTSPDIAGVSTAPRTSGRKRKADEEKVSSLHRAAARSRRQAVHDAWQANKLGVHLDPETLAERVHGLKADNVHRDTIQQYSSSFVREGKPGDYFKSYQAHKRKLAIKRYNAEKYLKDKETLDKQRAVNKRKKLKREKWQRVADMEAQGVDFKASMVELEQITRGIKTDKAGELACSRAVTWCIEQRRGEEALDEYRTLRKSNTSRKAKDEREEGASQDRPSKRLKDNSAGESM